MKAHLENPEFTAYDAPLRAALCDASAELVRICQMGEAQPPAGSAADRCRVGPITHYAGSVGCTVEQGPGGWRVVPFPAVALRQTQLLERGAALRASIDANPHARVLCGSTSATRHGRVRTGTRSLHVVPVALWEQLRARPDHGSTCDRCAAQPRPPCGHEHSIQTHEEVDGVIVTSCLCGEVIE